MRLKFFFQSEEPTFLLQVTFLDQIFSSSFTYMKRHRDVHLGNFNNKKNSRHSKFKHGLHFKKV